MVRFAAVAQQRRESKSQRIMSRRRAIYGDPESRFTVEKNTVEDCELFSRIPPTLSTIRRRQSWLVARGQHERR